MKSTLILGAGRWFGLGLSLALWLTPLVAADVPSVEQLFPAGGQLNSTQQVALTGKVEPWPLRVWSDSPALQWNATTNKGTFQVVLSSNAPPGPHLVRFYSGEGSSEPRLFVAGECKEILEKEPNDNFSKPQPIEQLPVTINGRLERAGDVDSYEIPLLEGQWLVASVQAYQLGSKVDAILRLVDLTGVEVAYNNDGATLDPFLVWRANRSGRYILQIFGFAYPANSDVRFSGNAGDVYRLLLTSGPYVRCMIPSSMDREHPRPIQLLGWNLGPNLRSTEMSWTPSPGASAAADPWWIELPGAHARFPISFSKFQEFEDKDFQKTNPPAGIVPPAILSGCIGAGGEQDRFPLRLQKDQEIRASVSSAALGFPLDACIEIQDPSGKRLARQEPPEPGRDPVLEWKAPADGKYCLAIENLVHHGGPDFRYRVVVERVAPEFHAIASAAALTLGAGETNQFKVTIKRSAGFAQPLKASFRGLPDGISMDPSSITNKESEITVHLRAASNAPAFQGPIQLWFEDPAAKSGRAAVAELSNSAADNGVPGGFPDLLIRETDQIWLTIRPGQKSK